MSEEGLEADGGSSDGASLAEARIVVQGQVRWCSICLFLASCFARSVGLHGVHDFLQRSILPGVPEPWEHMWIVTPRLPLVQV